MHQHEAFALCQSHLNRFVRIQMNDGAIYDGVIEHVDADHVFVACPVREEELEEEQRAVAAGFGGYGGYPYGGYGYGGYPYGGFGYGGYPYWGYPRYRRFALPLAALLGLSLLPYY